MSSTRNASTLLLVALTTACASHQTVEIRPLGAATVSAPVSARIAEGRAHLLLGDAGLALESFRRALAAEPRSVAALQGLAACYDLMGRFDLSRNYYEQALAIAPHDRATLDAFATSLATQNLVTEAAAVRAEMVPANSTAKIGRPVLVTIILPPARPLDALPKPASVAQDNGFKPRLERMSFVEVALITLPSRVTSARSAGQVAALAPRVVPTGALPRPTVRLLNAARRQGIAAQARGLLERQGWRGIVIGDAPRARLTSLILYPAGHQAVARRLGNRFNTALRQQAGAGREIVVLLGRDALARGTSSRAG